MVITLSIESERPLSFKKLAEDLCVDDLVLVVSPEELPDTWGFFRKNHSSTLFTIWREDGMYNVSMDRLASYDDYRFFPYLVDTLNVHLTGKPYLYDNVSISTSWMKNGPSTPSAKQLPMSRAFWLWV